MFRLEQTGPCDNILGLFFVRELEASFSRSISVYVNYRSKETKPT